MGRLIDADKLSFYGFFDAGDYSIVRQTIHNAPTVEAIPKADYEARLKADLEAILVELQLEIEELYPEHQCTGELTGFADAIETITPIIQQKIDKLKGVEE